MNRSAAPKRAFAPRTRSLLVRTGALAATILFASVTTAHATIPLPKPRPDTAAIKVPPESKLSDARTLSVPLPTVRPLHRPAWATKSELTLAYQSAFDLARKGQWSKLSKQRRSPRDASLETALFWLRLEQPGSKVTFKEVQKFLDARPIWPRRQNLVRRAETLITKSLPLDVRLAWFSSNPPSTLNGRLKWIEALKQAGRADVMA
ncbi:MAG: hypothetical protein P8N43_01065, partial [Alphaproteobacteria bacterium]|nr:hypothetical protein [Alphaproteobacteria bacterium]